MNPQLVDTGKVYSIKPEDRKGDFTFTRSSAATRVNASGNIEKETQNLLTYSNDFSEWSSINTSETSGQSGYDGTNDAWLLSKSASSARVQQSISTSGIRTYSVYVKAGTLNYVMLNNSFVSQWFDLSNGTIGTNSSSANTIDASIESVGNGWYRCSLIFNSSISIVRIYPSQADNDVSGTSGNIYIQDAQLEQGLVARDYIETTTTAVEGGITDNVPRLDYTDSSCPALLLEPQRTNICPNSEDVSNWSLVNAVATSNDTISPEGVQNAAKIVTSNTGCDVKLTSIPVSPSTTYTATFYCKLTSGSGLRTRFYDNTNLANIEYYTYDSQLVVGEWKRVTRTFTTPAGCNNIQIWFLAASSSSSVTAHYWGYQLEQGSYATSYIPTYGSSVTRVVDASLNFSSSFSGVFGSASLTKYSILIDIKKAEQSYSGSSTFLNKGNNTQGRINYGGGSDLVYYSTATGYMTDNRITDGNPHKYLLVCNDGVIKQFFDGTLIDTDNNPNDEFVSFSLSGSTGSYADYDLSSLMAFNSALTDEEAIALTTI